MGDLVFLFVFWFGVGGGVFSTLDFFNWKSVGITILSH